MDWPTDDVEADNARIQPSKLSANIKKRKEPPSSRNNKQNKHQQQDSDNEDAFGNAIHNDNDDESDDEIRHTNKRQKVQEISSTQRVSGFKVINELTKQLAPKKIKSLDPRFMEYAGEYDPKKAAKNYEFVDDMRQQEADKIKAQLKKTKDQNLQSELKRKLQSTETKLRVSKQRKEKDEMYEKYREHAREMAKQGVTVQHKNKKRLEKELGAAKEFLSLSNNQVEKRLKHKRERKINKDRNLIKHTKQ